MRNIEDGSKQFKNFVNNIHIVLQLEHCMKRPSIASR